MLPINYRNFDPRIDSTEIRAIGIPSLLSETREVSGIPESLNRLAARTHAIAGGIFGFNQSGQSGSIPNASSEQIIVLGGIMDEFSLLSDQTTPQNPFVRRNQASISSSLDDQLKAWNKKMSGKDECPAELQFIKEMALEQQQVIQNWLLRLEETRDFRQIECQQPLAEAVCGMLQFLSNASFRDSFFIQSSLNLEGCGDRAAMSFNELYFVWQLEKLKASAPSVSKKEELSLLVRAAKTNALRQALQRRIDAQEQELKIPALARCEVLGIELSEEMYRVSEGVEIFLYYETHLREQLNLLTFMKNRLYDFGRFESWINEAELVAEVEHRYLCFAPLVELRDLDPTTQSSRAAIRRAFDQRLETIENELAIGKLIDSEYLAQMTQLDFERQKADCDLTSDWLKKQMR